MFREIRIKSYRGLRDITLTELGLVNVLVGDNNSGKTSVLEAIQLFTDQDVLESMISVARKREIPLTSFGRNRLQPFDAFLYSFPMYQEQFKEVYIEAYSDMYGHCRVGVRGEIHNDNLYWMDLTQAEMRRYDSICDEDGMIRVVDGEYIYEKDELEEGDFVFRETQLKPEKRVFDNKQQRSMKRKGNIMVICENPKHKQKQG